MRIRAEIILLPIIFIITRLFGHPQVMYNTDVIQFALALKHMDLATHQPHPPGYIWFVMLGRANRGIVGDDHAALIFTSILLGLAVLVLLQAFAAKYFGRGASVIAGLIFCFSPVSWFFSVVGLNYMADALVAISGALLFYIPGRCPGRQSVFLRALMGALIVGFRPQALIFIVPVWVYFLILCRGKRLWGLAGFVLGNLVWIGATMVASGTINIFTPAAHHVFRPEVSGYKALIPALMKSRTAFWQLRLYTFETLPWAGAIVLPVCIIYLLFRGWFGGRFRLFFIIWTAPHILFSLLIFIIQPGHFVYLLPAIALVPAVPLGRALDAGKVWRGFAYAVTAILVVSMGAFTLLAPGSERIPSVGLKEIERSDKYYLEAFGSIAEIAELENTIILTEDFRHIFYYFPEARGIGFTFQSLKMLGDNPLVLPGGEFRKLKPVEAETVDVDDHVYRIKADERYTKLVYFGRLKWKTTDEELVHAGMAPGVGYMPLSPEDYIYFAPKRIWWVGDDTETGIPEGRYQTLGLVKSGS